MAFLSRTVTAANGSNANFAVSFPLRNGSLGRVEVDVFVHPTGSGVLGGAKVAGTDFNWASDGLITFTGGHIPPAGNVVDIRRHTLDNALANTPQAGGSLKSSELAANDLQLLYLAEEAEDAKDDLQTQANTLTTNLAAEVTNRTADVDAEEAARIAAVSGEAAARASADTAEATARTNADNVLSGRIGGVEGRVGTVIVNGTVVDMSAYPLPILTPEQFGALHTAGHDDGQALHDCSLALNILGGGTIWMDPGQTYWVGGQTHNGALPQGGTYTWAPTTSYPIEVSGCFRPVKIMGNGACIKTLAGKLYGTFDDAGVATVTPTPYFGTGISTPYQAMVYVHGCSGLVEITGLELDGNIAAQSIGGTWGDNGRQIQMTGINLADNTGPLRIDVRSHHHALDGLIGNGPGLLTKKENVVITGSYHNNGRQNISHVGGNGWHFGPGIELMQAGKGLGATMTYSPPGAGIDIEAEGGKWVVNTTMESHFIDDNTGPGILSDTNSFVDGFHARGGKVVGSTDWSLWPFNPRFIFEDQITVGCSVNHYTRSNPDKATKFIRGIVTDDVTRSPSGVVFGSGGNNVIVNNGAGTQNVLFDAVRWIKTSAIDGPNGSQGVWATQVGWRLHNCVIENLSAFNFLVYGIYSGDRTEIINANTFPGPAAASLFLLEAGPALDSFMYGHSGFGYARTRYKANLDQRNVGTAS